MKLARIAPLLLASLLQLAPMGRALLLNATPAAPAWAVVAKWAVGAFALLGFHAVAGATNVINSPDSALGTNGVFFSSPDNSE